MDWTISKGERLPTELPIREAITVYAARLIIFLTVVLASILVLGDVLLLSLISLLGWWLTLPLVFAALGGVAGAMRATLTRRKHRKYIKLPRPQGEFGEFMGQFLYAAARKVLLLSLTFGFVILVAVGFLALLLLVLISHTRNTVLLYIVPPLLLGMLSAIIGWLIVREESVPSRLPESVDRRADAVESGGNSR
jgi:hypothetical protein